VSGNESGSGVAGDFFWALVVAEVNEFGVAEDAAGGPFIEFDFGNEFGFEPDVIFHVLGGNALSPVGLAAGHRWEVCEGAVPCGQGFEEGVKFAADSGGQAGADFGGEKEFGVVDIRMRSVATDSPL
jgi:hypothetical protein